MSTARAESLALAPDSRVLRRAGVAAATALRGRRRPLASLPKRTLRFDGVSYDGSKKLGLLLRLSLLLPRLTFA